MLKPVNRSIQISSSNECLKEKKLAKKYLNTAKVILVALDRKGEIILLNDWGHKILGYKQGELIGKDWFETVLPKEQLKKVKSTFRKVIGGKVKEVENFTNHVVRKDGNQRFIRWYNTVMKDEQGNITGTFSSGEDITEYREAEDELRESEEKYRAIFETSKDALMTLEPPNWKFSTGNPAIIKMFGVKDVEQFTSLGPWNLSPKYQPDGQKSSVKAKKMIEIALKKGSHFFEWTHKRYKGENFFATVLLTRFNLKGKDILHATVKDITEQKIAQQKLKESEAKYRNLVERATDGIIIIQDRKIKYANPAVSQILGYKQNDVIGSSFTRYLYPSSYNKVLTNYIKRLTGKKAPPIYEAVLKKDDGSPVYVEINAGLIDYEEKKADLVIVRDISARHKTEEKLKLVSSATEQLSEGIAIVDLKGNILFSNKAFAQVHGYKPGELQGKNLSIFHNKDQMLSVKTANKEVMKKGHFHGEIWHARKDGSTFPTMMHSTLMYEGKTPVAMIGSLRDITEKKKAEEKLKESELKFKTLVRNSPGMIYMANPDWSAEILSRSKELSGYAIEDFNSRKISWIDMIHPKDKKKVLEEGQKLTKKPYLSVQEYRIITKDRSVKWAEDHKISIFENNKFKGIYGVVYDITEKKLAEIEKEKIDLIKSTILRDVSHELGTPLSLINMAAGMIKESVNSGKFDSSIIKKYNEIIQRNAVTFKRLVDSLIDLSKLRGATKFKVERFDPCTVMKELLKVYEPLVVMKKLKLKSDLDKYFKISGNKNQFQMLVRNLIDNAIKFTEKGYIDIRCSKNKTHLTFSVKDTGRGIKEGFKKKVFREFLQEDPSIEGLGIGLSVVQKVIDLHDGKIKIESKFGKGTKVTVKLPIK